MRISRSMTTSPCICFGISWKPAVSLLGLKLGSGLNMLPLFARCDRSESDLSVSFRESCRSCRADVACSGKTNDMQIPHDTNNDELLSVLTFAPATIRNRQLYCANSRFVPGRASECRPCHRCRLEGMPMPCGPSRIRNPLIPRPD